MGISNSRWLSLEDVIELCRKLDENGYNKYREEVCLAGKKCHGFVMDLPQNC